MQRLKSFRIFFSLAALLFVAKPFFGFGMFNQQLKLCIPHTILVKSFTKRKPEGLEDAKANIESIHRLLINPLAVLFSAISPLLLSLFPVVFKNGLNISAKVLSDIRYSLLPLQPAYLLLGNLII
ncbi:MAG: hypothetical protein ACXVB0_18110 [Mucilaginibacter sp.]